jgi:hypothetical protein
MIRMRIICSSKPMASANLTEYTVTRKLWASVSLSRLAMVLPTTANFEVGIEQVHKASNWRMSWMMTG